MFTGNEVLFLPGWIYMAERFRDMEADYGIIPYMSSLMLSAAALIVLINLRKKFI